MIAYRQSNAPGIDEKTREEWRKIDFINMRK